jgi:basic membrane lipoprotein Med (substrate-binding protein (PBP1-ABC) superfamily)
VLSSELKKVDVAVYATINALVHSRFRANGNAIFTTANGGIGIGKISPKIPTSIVKQVNAVKAKMAAGRIKHIPTTP